MNPTFLFDAVKDYYYVFLVLLRCLKISHFSERHNKLYTMKLYDWDLIQNNQGRGE